MNSSFSLSLKIIMGLLLMAESHSALSSCTADQQKSYTFTLPAIDLAAARNQTPGTPIGNPISIGTGPAVTVRCSSMSYLYYHQFSPSAGMVASDFSGIYKTNIPGIGVGITSVALAPAFLAKTVTNTPALFASNSRSSWDSIFQYGYKLQFYVIGPVEPGDDPLTLPSPLIEAWVNNGPLNSLSGGAKFSELLIGGSIQVTPKACKTPDITVNLGKHSASDFPIVGSGSTPVAFDFRINDCDPGMTAVKYEFKPASGITLSTAPYGQYLTLDSSSNAIGVGVQLLKNDGVTAVAFNTPIAAPTTGGVNGYNKTSGGSFSIPLKARYIRIGTISAGSANSAAEFVMTYE